MSSRIQIDIVYFRDRSYENIILNCWFGSCFVSFYALFQYDFMIHGV